MRWPWEKKEPEARAASYTDSVLDAQFARAAATETDAGSVAVVEACIALWERSLAAATITPVTGALAGVTPQMMALAGRALAVCGEAVFVPNVVEDGVIELLPVSSISVTGPAHAWIYLCAVPGPSNTDSRYFPADAVLHFRSGADPQRPWRGRGALQRAQGSAKLVAAIENSLNQEAKLPVARVSPYLGGPDQAKAYGDALVKGGMVTVGATSTPGTPSGQEPASRHKPQTLGPEPDQVMDSVRTHAGQDICSAFGVPATLFAPTGDGAGQREAWRRWWLSSVDPVARIIEAELRDKLEPMARVTLDALRASDEDARSRAVSRRAQAFKTFVDAGVEPADALQRAGLVP